MSERKAWSESEDSILKELYEKRQVKRWSEIAQLMESEFHIRGRNGKQCRERYHNHLDDSIRHDKWTPQEEQALATHHDQLGNRWAELSRYLPGRSENDIKNQFYSILRRGLRQINAVVRRHLKRYKELEVDTLYRITERRKARDDEDGNQLKRTVMRYAFKTDEPTEQEAQEVKRFIEQVKGISKGKQKREGRVKEQKELKEQKEQKEQKEERERESRQAEVKVEQEKSQPQLQKQSQIDSAEYRDNFPVEVKKEAEKFRKSSFFNFTLQQPEMEMEVRAQRIPYRLRKRSSFYSNHSFDMSSPRLTELDPIMKALEMQETDNFSPRPQFYATSPYFDQSKHNFWTHHEFH